MITSSESEQWCTPGQGIHESSICLSYIIKVNYANCPLNLEFIREFDQGIGTAGEMEERIRPAVAAVGDWGGGCLLQQTYTKFGTKQRRLAWPQHKEKENKYICGGVAGEGVGHLIYRKIPICQ